MYVPIYGRWNNSYLASLSSCYGVGRGIIIEACFRLVPRLCNDTSETHGGCATTVAIQAGSAKTHYRRKGKCRVLYSEVDSEVTSTAKTAKLTLTLMML